MDISNCHQHAPKKNGNLPPPVRTGLLARAPSRFLLPLLPPHPCCWTSPRAFANMATEQGEKASKEKLAGNAAFKVNGSYISMSYNRPEIIRNDFNDLEQVGEFKTGEPTPEQQSTLAPSACALLRLQVYLCRSEAGIAACCFSMELRPIER